MRFGDHGKRRVLAAFDGGDITSDAGGVLLRETARRLNLLRRMAAGFEDRRKQDQVAHTLPC
ncbi:MAG: transposase [Rhodospirillum sp.]|nr:transposase [Rhodospirillum sp.]MCF8488348.1 transposase [Rhodospirillum sp.]